jgi:hypothetical protein
VRPRTATGATSRLAVASIAHSDAAEASRLVSACGARSFSLSFNLQEAVCTEWLLLLWVVDNALQAAVSAPGTARPPSAATPQDSLMAALGGWLNAPCTALLLLPG